MAGTFENFQADEWHHKSRQPPMSYYQGSDRLFFTKFPHNFLIFLMANRTFSWWNYLQKCWLTTRISQILPISVPRKINFSRKNSLPCFDRSRHEFGTKRRVNRPNAASEASRRNFCWTLNQKRYQNRISQQNILSFSWFSWFSWVVRTLDINNSNNTRHVSDDVIPDVQ